MRILSALFQTVRFVFGTTGGGESARKKRAGTSRDRERVSAPSTVLGSSRKHPDDMALACAFCFFVRGEVVQAITVMNGQAVCYDHSYYAQGGEFTKILTMVKRDELRD